MIGNYTLENIALATINDYVHDTIVNYILSIITCTSLFYGPWLSGTLLSPSGKLKFSVCTTSAFFVLR